MLVLYNKKFVEFISPQQLSSIDNNTDSNSDHWNITKRTVTGGSGGKYKFYRVQYYTGSSIKDLKQKFFSIEKLGEKEAEKQAINFRNEIMSKYYKYNKDTKKPELK